MSYRLDPRLRKFIEETLQLADWEDPASEQAIGIIKLIREEIFSLDDALKASSRRLAQIDNNLHSEIDRINDGGWPVAVNSNTWLHEALLFLTDALRECESHRRLLVRLVTSAREMGHLPPVPTDSKA